jgi:hypothetical protein
MKLWLQKSLSSDKLNANLLIKVVSSKKKSRFSFEKEQNI